MDKAVLLRIILQWKESASDNEFKARAYSRLYKTIKEYPAQVLTKSIIQSMTTITTHMKEKIINILDARHNNPTNERDQVYIMLKGHYGIGATLARDLYNRGIRTSADLNKIRDELPQSVQLMLKYKPLPRIPRALITQFHDILNKVCAHDICGSYRRGAESSKDVDVLVVDVPIKQVVDELYRVIGTRVITINEGKEKTFILVRMGTQYIRVDLMTCTREEYPAFLLYLTGSANHNIMMRNHARAHGYLLNQHGLFKGKKRIVVKNERDIFSELKLDYKTPEERNT